MSEGSWSIVSLGELIASIEAGASFRCRETPPEADEVGVAKVSAVSWGRYDENESKTCLNASRIDLSLLIQKGDFLISRANTVQLVGACVIAERVTKQVMLSDKTLRIQFKDPSLKPWVLHYLRSREGRNQIEALCTGNQESMRNISQKSIRQIQLPLAPAEERDRVIAYLDQQLSRLQASVEIFGIIQAKLKQARASILKAAVEGRLVETEAEPDADQAFHEIAEILNKRKNLRRPKWKTPLQASKLTIKSHVPAHWQAATIDQLCDVGTGATPRKSDIKYWKNGYIPWITSSACNAKFVDAASDFVTVDALRETNLSLYPSGTILIAMYGEGKTRGQHTMLRIEATTNQAMAALSTSCLENPTVRWFRIFLDSNYLEMRRKSSGGVQPNLNLSIVKSIALPFPPITEQVEIADEVDRRFSVLDQVEATVTTSLARCSKLRQAILKQAFRG